jgi:Tfp pilus assembly protein PilN
MRAVNLLPKDESRRSAGGPSRLPLVAAAGGAALVTVLSGAALLSARGEAEALRSQVVALEEAIARAPRPDVTPALPASLVQERTSRLAALTAATSSRVPFDRLLREIALVLPEGAWLTGITATTPSPTASAGTASASPAGTEPEQGVTIEGVATSHESVARVLSRLAVVPSLAHVQLAGTNRVDLEQPTAATGDRSARAVQRPRRPSLVTFTVNASVRPGGSS